MRQLLTLSVVITLAALAFAAENPEELASRACDYYQGGDYDQALTTAEKVITADAAPEVKVDALKCKACSHVALSDAEPAKEAISEMLAIQPVARFSPEYAYPPPVFDLYHQVNDSRESGTMDIRTVAIGDFEDNSVYSGKFKNMDFSHFERALIHTITADLSEATSLAIVDRQRTDTILQELELTQEGYADPKSAVKMGQLLGAHTFIFGQYMILSKDTVRIDARVVHTATGEIILTKQVTGKFAGKPEAFLDLERELVVALAEGIDAIAEAQGTPTQHTQMTNAYFEAKESGINDRKDYVEALFLSARAYEQEEQGDYKKARELWSQVAKKDPLNEAAPVRVNVLDAFANFVKQE